MPLASCPRRRASTLDSRFHGNDDEKGRSTLLFCFLIALGLAVAPAHAASKELRGISETDARVRLFRDQIDAWDVDAAAANLSKLELESPTTSAGVLTGLRSILEFHRGEYARARTLLDQVRDPEQIRENGFSLVEVIRKTDLHTRDFVHAKVGHFEVSYKPGVDSILVDDLLGGLEESYRFFESLLGFAPPPPVRVEIYSTFDAFRSATTLTERDLEVSGAVGVCKFNKLMVLSPRLLIRGYRYVNTAVHEYVHFMVYRMTKNNTPVWLHEGIASYLEDLFDRRNAVAAPEARYRTVLAPFSETLLAGAVQKNSLVPFSRMHPSLVKLDTREEVALAFAQVQVAIELLMVRTEGQGLAKLLALLGEGNDLSRAFESVLGMNLESFELAAREYYLTRGLTPVTDLEVPSLALKKGDGEEPAGEEELEVRQIRHKQAREFARLGDLLKSRSQFPGAVIEYRKALTQQPHSPVIMNKLGQTLLLAGRAPESIQILLECKELYPDFSTTFHTLAESYLAEGQIDRAIENYREVTKINPFHPVAYQRLASLYEKKGMVEQAKSAEEKLRSLGRYGR